MKIEEQPGIEASDYKVMIYPASRQLSTLEAKKIAEELYDFLSTWTADENPLTTSFKIERNQFVIICADEEQQAVTDDALTHLNEIFRDFDVIFNLGFSDREKVCYLQNEEIKTSDLETFITDLKSGNIADNAQVFDFSKSHFSDFLATFLLPLQESWVAAYLK